jgi:predicted transcriptional regulator
LTKRLLNLGITLPTEKEIVVYGEKSLEIVDALNSTSLKILKIARNGPINVSAIGKELKLSEAFISEIVRTLEELKLVSITYEKGKRGVSKISASALEKITIMLKDEESESASSIATK